MFAALFWLQQDLSISLKFGRFTELSAGFEQVFLRANRFEVNMKPDLETESAFGWICLLNS
jgi:hypothetical protein